MMLNEIVKKLKTVEIYVNRADKALAEAESDMIELRCLIGDLKNRIRQGIALGFVCKTGGVAHLSLEELKLIHAEEIEEWRQIHGKRR